MLKFAIFLWIGLIAWNWHTSLAESEDINQSASALQDTAIQRSKFCLTVLEPLLTRFAELQDQRSYPDDVIPNGTTPTLDRMEGQETKMENKLLAMLTRIEAQLANIAFSVKPIPNDFFQIGSRYFYINAYNRITLTSAHVQCRKVGGHLASIKNQEELTNLKSYFSYYDDFWLATNDQAVEGHFVSSVSNKTAPFLNWGPGEPSDKNHTKNCVFLKDNFMFNSDCLESRHYICQLDNDI